MKTLILGAGEVGTSLAEVLRSVHDVVLLDKDPNDVPDVKVLNICYPFSDAFVETTKRYIRQYEPLFTIIHSTVPVGTTRAVAYDAVHSPVHGVHPHLAEGMKTFPKFVGGRSSMAVTGAVQFMRLAGIDANAISSSEASELSKLLCTTYYAWNVVYAKEAAALCDRLGLPFDEVYTQWNEAYNRGYEQLGMPNVRRPVLKPVPGPIGGHCLIPNATILAEHLDPSFAPATTILDANECYAHEERDKKK